MPAQTITYLHVAFSDFWKVWRYRYALVYKSYVFFVSYVTNTIVLQQCNLLHIVVLQQWIQKMFSYKMEITHEMHVMSRNILMIKCMDNRKR